MSARKRKLGLKLGLAGVGVVGVAVVGWWLFAIRGSGSVLLPTEELHPGGRAVKILERRFLRVVGWSPDGTMISVYYNRLGASDEEEDKGKEEAEGSSSGYEPLNPSRGRLWIVRAADGEILHKFKTQFGLCTDGYPDQDWLPDGKAVLINSGDPGAGGGRAVYRCDVATGDSRVLMEVGSQEGIAVSQDGSKIALFDPPKREVVIYDAQGKRLGVAFTGEIASYVWLPGGDLLVDGRLRSGGQAAEGLFRIAGGAGAPVRIFGRARIVPGLVTNVVGEMVPAAELKRNPDGTATRAVGVLSLGEGKLRLARCGEVPSVWQWSRGCALRLEGRLASFFLSAAGGDSWAVRMSDGALLALTDFGGRVRTTCGAADGKKVALTVTSMEGGSEEIWILTLDEKLIMAQQPVARVPIDEENLMAQ